MKWLCLCLSLFAFQQGSFAVVYGIDDRLDTLEAANDLEELAKSSLAIMKKEKLVKVEGGYQLIDNTRLSEKVCAGEQFEEQKTSSYCSAFLVGEDLVATAGHCVSFEKRCKEDYFYIFDYRIDDSGEVPSFFRDDQVYQCQKLLLSKQSLDQEKIDYALIQLTKKVTDRKPLKLASNDEISGDHELLLIGHPSGLPQKVTANGKLRENKATHYFTALIDGFSGNSGSPVFSRELGKVIGIHTHGRIDYDLETEGGKLCKRVHTCDPEEEYCMGGLIVNRLTPILDTLSGE